MMIAMSISINYEINLHDMNSTEKTILPQGEISIMIYVKLRNINTVVKERYFAKT